MKPPSLSPYFGPHTNTTIPTRDMSSTSFQQNPPMVYNSFTSSSGIGPTIAMPSDDQFQRQLEQLTEMGFHDQQENLRALQESNGDIDGAVAYLIYESSNDES
jgi:hypothetical protein